VWARLYSKKIEIEDNVYMIQAIDLQGRLFNSCLAIVRSPTYEHDIQNGYI